MSGIHKKKSGNGDKKYGENTGRVKRFKNEAASRYHGDQEDGGGAYGVA